jgi:hypothetical protein
MSAIAIFALACCGGDTMFAQKFQSIFGGVNTELGYGGVKPLDDGGYIAIGETNTPSGGGNNYDIYLVRTNGDGTLAWSKSYDLGGVEDGLDIEEVKHDPTGLNGFIITGDVSNIDCLGKKNLFLLRVDGCGNVIWAETYGTKDLNTIGMDVIEMTHDAPCKGRQGDFVVCGIAGDANGIESGFLLRVRDQSPAKLLWSRTYHGPCDDGSDRFFGLTEAVTGADGGVPGDIIVCGTSSSYCQVGGGGFDGFIAHLDGCGDMPGVFPYGASVQGGKEDDLFQSVIELTEGDYRGTIVAAGASNINCNNNPKPEAYVVQTRSWPCRRVADVTLGDGACERDWAYCVREVTSPHPDAGAVVVTGEMTLAGGLGGGDVFAQRFTPGTLAPIAPITHLYGGKASDVGYSIMPVNASHDRCFTDGYVIAGSTLSFGDEYQLYLIKTDANLVSGCNEVDARAVEVHPDFPIDCVDPKIIDIGEECTPKEDDVCRKWEKQLCYDADGSQPCRAPECPCTGIGFKPNIAPSAPSGDAIVSAYPNPVKRGDDITLHYTLAKDAVATLTVDDINGREIYRRSRSYFAGNSDVAVSTRGWSAGTYIVTVKIGDRVETHRIIVADK